MAGFQNKFSKQGKHVINDKLDTLGSYQPRHILFDKLYDADWGCQKTVSHSLANADTSEEGGFDPGFRCVAGSSQVGDGWVPGMSQ